MLPGQWHPGCDGSRWTPQMQTPGAVATEQRAISKALSVSNAWTPQLCAAAVGDCLFFFTFSARSFSTQSAAYSTASIGRTLYDMR